MTIAVDFDGTLIRGGFPDVSKGTPNTKLLGILADMRENGHKIILWTCRDGRLLKEAVDFCRQHGLEFDAVNENIREDLENMKFDHEPRKVVAHMYIDDLSLTPEWEDD